MGSVEPVTVKAKIILQLLWKENLAWDHPVPSSLEDEFKTFKRTLLFLTNTFAKFYFNYNAWLVRYFTKCVWCLLSAYTFYQAIYCETNH